MTTKRVWSGATTWPQKVINRHIKHKENVTCEWVEDGTVAVSHVSGKCNPWDIFTKEMHNGANFRRLRDLFMSRALDFLKVIFTSLHPLSKPLHEHVAQSVNYVLPLLSGILDVLILQPLSRTRNTISCLVSSAGRCILSCTTEGLSSRLLWAIIWEVLVWYSYQLLALLDLGT